MDPICPLLMLGTDRRAVCNGFDADHCCSLLDGPDPLTRAFQIQFCLSPMHPECPHFARHTLASAGPRIDGVPPPDPDVVMAPTRLVIDAASLSSRRSSSGAVLGAAVATVVLVATGAGAVASGAIERVSTLLSVPQKDAGQLAAPAALPTFTPGATASARPVATSSPVAGATAAPSEQPSVQPTGAVLSSTAYVVQAGDTLKAIADRHGTTVAALQTANAIADQNLIEIGEVLIIP